MLRKTGVLARPAVWSVRVVAVPVAAYLSGPLRHAIPGAPQGGSRLGVVPWRRNGDTRGAAANRQVKMQLRSVQTIYRDGKHNAFTGIARWRGKYWACFRSAASHCSLEGRICVISSADLKVWSGPAIAINTPEDNRDPKLFVCHDRLHVTSMTVRRSFEKPETGEGRARTEDFYSLVSYTEDGIHWSTAQRVWEPFKALWWTEARGERVYGSGYACRPVDDQGNPLPGSPRCELSSTEFVASDDGLDWRTLSIISREREPSECALAFLPDGRAVGFLRHNLEQDPCPQIVVADPPYLRWKTAYTFPYFTNGTCLGMVGGTLVASSRAMLDWDSTPPEVVELADAGAVRGLLIMTVDVDAPRVTPELVISCPPHPDGDWPDVSYAGIVDLGGGEFAMSYYQGLKNAGSDVMLAWLHL
ncbi:MAG: sialidase family protein [Candidatus Latescibacterota bacterium]